MTRPKARRGRPRLRPSDSEEDPAEQILSAARSLFVEKGYSTTSLAAIAAEAGLQRASLYHHFASKDAMLAEIARRYLAPLLDVLERFASEDRPPELQLYRYLRIDLAYVLAAPYDLGALFHLPEVRDRDRFGALWDAVDAIKDAWTAWIENGAASGAFDVADPQQAGLIVEGSYLGVLGTPRQPLRDDPDATAHAFAGFVLRSLLADHRVLADLERRAVELDGSAPTVAEVSRRSG